MGFASLDSVGIPQGMTGVLTLTDVAKTLGQPEIGVSRLIARRRLAATRLPGRDDKGSWKVTTDALHDYVASGAPDVGGLLSNDGRWFVGNGYEGDAFVEQLAALSRAEIPKGEVLKKLIADRQAATPDRTIDLPLTMAANMRKAVYATAPGKRYRNAGQQFLASRLRSQAKKIIDGGAFTASPISTLYGSPDAYARITSSALDALKKCSALSYTSVAMLPGRNIGISFSLPMTALLQLIDTSELIDKAF
jgi:hypothetical protein